MNVKLFIEISIVNYNNFEDNSSLITLIDNELMNMSDEQIYNTNHLVKWQRSLCCDYDYICVIELNTETHGEIFKNNIKNCNNNNDEYKQIILTNKVILNYFKNKFNMIQSSIKYNFQEFGDSWKINYSIEC